MAKVDAVVIDGKVQMLDATGKPVAVPREQVADIIQQGGSVEAPDAHKQRVMVEEEGGVVGTLTAAAEGAASGLTFGVSDQILVRALGEEYRERAAARDELHPIARGAGEVAGAIAPALVTGGGSAAARAILAPGRIVAGGARALEGAAGRKVLGAALGGAFEGAAQGAGQEISDAALGGREVTAERLLAAAGEGALWGGGAGAAARITTDVAGKAAKIALDQLTEGRTLREVIERYTPEGQAARRLGAEVDEVTAKRLGSKLVQNGVDPNNVNAARKTIDAAVAKADDTLRRIAKAAESASIRPNTTGVLASVKAEAAKLRAVPLDDYQKAADRLEKQFAPLTMRSGTSPVVRRDGSQVARKGFTFEDALTLRSKIDEMAKGEGHLPEALRAVRQRLDDAIEDTVQRTDDTLHKSHPELAAERRDIKDAWRAATEDANDWRLLQRAADKNVKAPEASAAPGLPNSLLGLFAGLATGNVGVGALTAMLGNQATAAASRFLLQRGGATLATVAEKLMKSEGRLASAVRAMVDGKPSGVRVGTLAGLAAPIVRGNVVQQIADVESGEAVARAIEPLVDQPELAETVAQTLRDDAAYLKAQLPPGYARDLETLTPAAAKQQLSDVDARKLVRIAEALNDPVGTLEAAASGKASPEQVQAIRDRRPELYNLMRNRVIEYAAERGEELPFSRRNMLGQVFEFPADWSLVPANLGAAQAAAAASQPPPGASPNASQGANISESVGRAFALPSNPVGQPLA